MAGDCYRVLGVPRDASQAEDLTYQELKGAPAAVGEAKRLVRDLAFRPIDPALTELTATRIAEIRTREEAREGLDAFLNRRPPHWMCEGADQ